jgi:dephospho-CoA kinase
VSGLQPYLLGLTGSIGTGKSTTAEMFRDAGIPVWDADQVVHDLYDGDAELISVMADIVPDAIVDGKVDRDRLKALIKTQPDVLTKVELAVHPRVAAHRQEFVSSSTKDLVLLDIPLLFEVGADSDCSGVLVVTTSPEEQRKRVLGRGTMSSETFAMILGRQMPLAEKIKRADFVIETKTLEQTRNAVHDLIAQISKRGAIDA